MALLFVDSFHHYATADLLEKWSGWINAAWDLTNTGGPGGYGYMSTPHSSRATYKRLPSASGATFIAGFHWKRATQNGDSYLVRVCDGTSIQTALKVNNSGKFFAVNGAGTTLGTSTKSFELNRWYYLELKVVIDSSAGTVELKVNGTKTGWLDLSSKVTQFTAAAQWNMLQFAGDNNNFDDHYVANLYVADGSGAAPQNDMLGECLVECLIAQAGNGTDQEWDCGTGTDRGQLVNDATPNDDAGSDYVIGDAAGESVTFAMEDLTTTAGTIYGVQACLSMNKADAGTRTVSPIYRHSGSDNLGTAQPVSMGGYYYYLDIQAKNPGADPGVWTVTDVNALEFGAEVVT